MKVNKEKLIKIAKVVGSLALEAAIIILCKKQCGDNLNGKRRRKLHRYNDS